MNLVIPWKRTLFTSTQQCFQRLKTAKDRKEHFFRVNSWKATNEQEYEPLNQEEERKPKKKVALLLGYNGSEYQGMQL